ncbi:MerR family DNA-binding transcriptional regulator [Melghirimyces algeriensis]|uniref:MerR family DNA-binding transcriptional regulator n=1 Tax=Melghirimyces algeriensis TaxID=910412 RepID=UPI00115AE0AD
MKHYLKGGPFFFTIGEVSKVTNLSQYTLRHYEKTGIIPPPARNRNNLSTQKVISS